MRKVLWTLLLLAMGLAAQAQTPEDIMEKYKHADNVSVIHVTHEQLVNSVGNMNDDRRKLAESIELIHILTISGCTQTQLSGIPADIKTLEQQGFSLFEVPGNDGAQSTFAVIFGKNAKIANCIMFRLTGNSAQLIHLKGNLDPQELVALGSLLQSL